MAIWIGNRGDSYKPKSRWMFWAIVLVCIGLYIGAGFCIRSVNEDKVSHAVRVSLPLLLGYGWIVQPGENYDPATAKWGNLDSGIAVFDGQIVFVRTPNGDYALKLFDQTLVPEQVKYEWIKIGEKEPAHQGTATGEQSIKLIGRHLQWSGAKIGGGFLYSSNNSTMGLKDPFQLGGPFRSGDLSQFQDSLPPEVQFTSQSWKLNEMNGVKFDDQGFLK